MSEHTTSRYKLLLEAIDHEREAEAKYYQALSNNKTKLERIDSGILWYPLVITQQVYTVGEQIELTLERTKQLDQPHKFKSGVGCQIFKSEGGKNVIEIRAVVSYVKRNKISVILNEEVISKSELLDLKGQIGIELIYDDRPYKVMQNAIKDICNTESQSIKRLRDGITKYDAFEETKELHYTVTPDYLNATQQAALNGSIRAEHLSIIHGPPGTGKTTTLVATIKALLKEEKQILVCAPSNNAVDLLAQHLDMSGIAALRIGNVTRIADGLTHLTLGEKARMDPEWQHIKKVKIEANEVRRQASKFKRKFGQRERQERRDMYQEAKDLKNWARDLEEKLTNRLIAEARVICTTLIGVSHKSVKHLRFKTVVIDEASQALEPECWNAILRAEKTLLAGDHLQLAPTVKSDEAKKKGLADTLLIRMTDKIKHTYLLGIQYRMHHKILSFSNKQFYNNQLISDDQVKNRTLEGDEQPLVFIDTSGCGFEEAINSRSRSRYNEGEYFILREHFIQQGPLYQQASIGIISPYSEQVKYLRSKIESDDIYKGVNIIVNSIDGFQGQEKDIIYISLVRSNDNNEIGFLSDARRLNVAMTRARKKLIIIGDMSTLSQSQLFNDLAEHVEEEGLYQSAWEYMA